MKPITHLVFAAALTCGAQAASAQQSNEIAEVRTVSAESHVEASAVGSTRDRQDTLTARRSNSIQDYLDEMGFSAPSPFPSRGGSEIDD